MQTPQWKLWLHQNFPNAVRGGFCDRHIEFWEWVWSIEKDVRPRPFVALWPRGGGKCILQSMEILCADGRRVPIRDIEIGREIMSFNEATGHFEKDVISQKWESGEKACLRLKTRTGKTLTLTPEHRVLTFEGWKTAGELTLDDRLASPRQVSIEPTAVYSDEEVRLLAYLIAEGTTGAGSCMFTNADATIIADFIHCAETLGFWVKKGARYSWRLMGEQSGLRRKGTEVSAARRWLTGHGLTGCSALTKRVPEFVFGLPVRQKWMFLAAIVDTDGWIEVNRGRIVISLANRALVEDLAYLWMQVGVMTSIGYKPNKCAGAWTVKVDQEYIRLCAQNLPLRLKGEKLSAAAQIPRYSLLDTYPKEVCRSLPFGVNRKLRAQGCRLGTPYEVTRDKVRRALELVEVPQLRKLEESQVFWDKIVSIEAAGTQQTFDVEVAKNHNLITNQIVTHNSTSSELAVAALGLRGKRRYCMYVCDTQDRADEHLMTIATKLEESGIERKLNKYGNSQGWRRNRLRTNDFTVDALGLNVASRGKKIDDDRPDLIIFDDIDEEADTEEIIIAKRKLITKSVLPARAKGCAVLFVQNLIHRYSIATELSNLVPDYRADYLIDRIVSGPFKAIEDLDVELVFDEEIGANRYLIIGGEPTWDGQDIEACQEAIDTEGLQAFLSESQHEVFDTTGAFFQRDWFEIVDEVPFEAQRVRRWDEAATEGGGDWTVGVLMAKAGSVFYVEDVARAQLGPTRRDALQRSVAEADFSRYGLSVQQVGVQDPGSAGVDRARAFKQLMSEGEQPFAVAIERETGDKKLRADGFSREAGKRNVKLLRGAWNEAFLRELERFSGAESGVDDQVDAAGGAFNRLNKRRSLRGAVG